MSTKYGRVGKLLDRHQRWTKNSYAKNNKGATVKVTGQDAVRFCLQGAIDKCYPGSVSNQVASSRALKAVNSLFKGKGDTYSDVLDFNDADWVTFKDVQRVVKAAGI